MRVLTCDALTPSVAGIGKRLQKQDVPTGLDTERGLERGHQRHVDPSQLDRAQPPALSASSSAISSPVRRMSPALALSSSCFTLDAPGMATTFGLLTSHAS